MGECCGWGGRMPRPRLFDERSRCTFSLDFHQRSRLLSSCLYLAFVFVGWVGRFSIFLLCFALTGESFTVKVVVVVVVHYEAVVRV